MRSKSCPGLSPKEAFENYGGFLGHLLASADWGCDLAGT